MQKNAFIFASLATATVITLLSTTVTYYKYPKISRSPSSYDQVGGFPFELGRSFASSTVILSSSQTKYPINPYLLTAIFWFSGSMTFLWWLKHRKGKKVLLFAGGIAFLLMLIDVKTSSRCLSGYPIGFLSRCLDVTSPNGPSWFFAFLNYSFWYVIALVGASIVFITKDSPIRIVKLFTPPLILTFFSVVFHSSCGGFFCLFPSGGGYPLPFTSDNALVFFGIDFVLWWIVYNLILFIKRKLIFR